MNCDKRAGCGAGQSKAAGPAMTVVYDRNVHTVATHGPLKATIPLEGSLAMGGKGIDLNPMDLLSMGLAGCLLIVMGKAAETAKLDIVGAKAHVTYRLADCQLAEIGVRIHLPKKLAAADQRMLETASKKCPIHLAMHPNVKLAIEYIWPKE